MSGTVRAGYVKYIKRNCERLVMDADCRRVILQEKYITARKIDDYLKEAKRCWREDVVRELWNIRRKIFPRARLHHASSEQKERNKKHMQENFELVQRDSASSWPPCPGTWDRS